MSISKQVFFLPGRLGGRFCSVCRPASVVKGKVLVVPPFAEELNKSRRMMSLAAETLAEAGFLVAQIDLLGTGDSAGDFGDAGWSDWLDDLSACGAWLDQQVPEGELVVLALRAGCLLTCDWLRRHVAPSSATLLFWQPVASGKQFVAQFLRLKMASAMLADKDVAASAKGLRASLERGEPVEVAGYLLSPMLAKDLEACRLSLPDDWRGRVGLVETVGHGRDEASPWLTSWRQQLLDRGLQVELELVRGAPFWQTSEIEVLPELLETSRRFVSTTKGLT